MFRVSNVRSPSEHLSLDFLLKLQDNGYITDSGKEYPKEEVDELINLKRARKALELDKAFKMPRKTLKQKFIESELVNLDVPNSSRAYPIVYENALAASETLTKAELKAYIAEYVDCPPNNMFSE